jgi:S1-C subfamily serine protease
VTQSGAKVECSRENPSSRRFANTGHAVGLEILPPDRLVGTRAGARGPTGNAAPAEGLARARVLARPYDAAVDRPTAIALYERYAGAVAVVEVETTAGDLSIGSAFHIGHGIYVTARHVAERKIVSLQTTQPSREILRSTLGLERTETLSTPGQAVVEGSLVHPKEQVDVGIIKTTGLDAPSVSLDDPDEDVGRRLLLEPVLVMGYPRIPLALDPPALVVTTAEVNAAVSRYPDGIPALILSPTARGGFSGGLVLSARGTALGVVARSLVQEDEQVQLGFLSAMRVPQVIECLEAHEIERPTGTIGTDVEGVDP